MADLDDKRNGSRRGGRDIASAASRKGILSDRDIESLGETFRKAGSPIARRLAFAHLLEGLTPENAKLIREQIEHLPSDSAEFREFHYAWGAIAGADAVLNGADTPKDDMTATLAGWASADSTAAINWLNNLDAENHPEIAKLLGEKGSSLDELRNHLTVGLVYGLSDTDPQAAASYVLELANAGNGKADWMMGMITDKMLKTGDAATAAAWAQALPQGSPRAAALGTVARNYAASDPQAAVAWLTSIPASEDTTKGMQSAFATWAWKDSEASSQYINDMRPSTQKDWAINGYAPSVAHKDPAGAIAWANSVSDPAVREQTLIKTGQVYYHRVDREAAQAWLPNSGLSPEAQQQIIQPRGRGK